MSKLRQTVRSGFTLIELLLVIAIISILAAIVIIAINPARQIAQANNAQRSSNILTILNAVNQYMVDNRGAIPDVITASSTPICVTGVASSTLAPCIDFQTTLSANQLYLVSIPVDPASPGTSSTWYHINKTTSTNPRITVTAPATELGFTTISITR